MKESPILFSTPMVRGIWKGIKTKTRRIIKPQPGGGIRESVFVKSGIEDLHGYEVKLRYGNAGDLLWVRETWDFAGDSNFYFYKAGFNTHLPQHMENIPNVNEHKFRPSIFMPKEACRLWLKIKSIRIERLQDISEEDAIAEGIENVTSFLDYKASVWRNYNPYDDIITHFTNPIDSFMSLWQKINGEQSWDENPFVFVIEFEQFNK